MRRNPRNLGPSHLWELQGLVELNQALQGVRASAGTSVLCVAILSRRTCATQNLESMRPGRLMVALRSPEHETLNGSYSTTVIFHRGASQAAPSPPLTVARPCLVPGAVQVGRAWGLGL